MVAGLGWELLRHGRLAPAELAAVPHLQV